MAGCSKDNEDIKPTQKEEQKGSEEPEKPVKLKLSATLLTMQAGQENKIQILEGDGEYSCQITDSKIATAVLENNIITIKSLSIGNTELHVTDRKSKDQAKVSIVVGEAATPIPAGVEVRNNIIYKWPPELVPENGKIILEEGIVGIEFEAFRETPVREIIFPSTLKFIGEAAFSYCNNLEKAVLPSNLESLGRDAFYQCHALQEVNIPKSVKDIKANVFALCDKLHKVSLEEGLETIGESMFYGCSSLTEIKLPASLKQIQNNAFCSCSNLESIVIPNNITKIEETTFKYCNSLTFVQLSENLSLIGRYAFFGCKSLKKIELPKTLEKVRNICFWRLF